MSRLIDAEVLKRKLLREWVRDINEVNRFVDSLPSYQRSEDVPSAQPQRMRGRWNTYYHGGTDFSYSCARCGYGAPFDMKGGKVFQKKWNYCPNCGADMREEDADETD